ncbi:class I adenylate-forming enzyme family protein [Actinomadura sp. NPDC048394]|uniref:class I adenylate-forming enzyme family protein n=1 Tax=Actinomadura sp. NPDC048394 TaxID=3158223 RepID=UPI0033D6733A
MAAPDLDVRASSLVSGPPLEVLGDLLGGPRIDDLLRRAAERRPGRIALRSPGFTGALSGDLTYAEVEAAAERCARALKALLGDRSARVALALALEPAFPVAFFGILRSGNVPALVNPLLREDGLAHVLGLADARAAIVSPAMYRHLEKIRDRLPDLETVVLTHADDDLPGVPVLADLMDQAPDLPLPRPETTDVDEVACLQFTSGTTGPAKAVLLTHRNITVNAAQSAHAHRVDGSAVLFNYLPSFHLMHLTMAVTAATTLVLCAEPDPADAVGVAAEHEATHFYSLPMRLIKLGAHPRLAELGVPTLRTVLCGGSALPPPTTRALAEQFGVPVVQGYGLQETSPSTHFENLDDPKIRSSGPPVAGTDCRVVHLDTRQVQPVGAEGEIQVRGPQLMKGYHDRPAAEVTDAEGWFSTGDIGRIDADGHLFVLDRVKDVFKCDNWLVSPTEIERVLLGHDGVAECLVFDHPDEVSGAVAHAIVVPARDGVEAAELAGFVAERCPYYEHLKYVDLVEAIPRSATGKPLRRQMRERYAGGADPADGGR